MPIPFLAELVFNGIPGGISYWRVVKGLLAITVLGAIKSYSSGASNNSERQMHSKVIMITVCSWSTLADYIPTNIFFQGGTTGIGAAIAFNLAKRGAQVVLLTHHSPSDFFLIEYIEDLRQRSGNELIYAEQVDLSSTYSIRKFATKWIDNAPPRRLDMIILCAATFTPPGKARILTTEGIEETWMVNYLANFHLLSILSPAIRAQPPDRDVRVILSTCSSYITSPPLSGNEAVDTKDWSPAKAHACSKLALTTFGHAFQKHLDAYKRPDGTPMNARVVFVDPGYTRTPGMRRYLTRGTLWGLALYIILWQNIWLLLKSSEQGAQSFLYAAMEATIGRGNGGKLIKECMEVDFARADVKDEEAAKKLWEGSEKLIERIEREEAVNRALIKKEKEAAEKAEKEKNGNGKPLAALEPDVASGSGTEGKKSRSRRGRKAA
jgi:NAD(P)-dependent dehydrogenase (short-subunit alcohol dehydrogenase family)